MSRWNPGEVCWRDVREEPPSLQRGDYKPWIKSETKWGIVLPTVGRASVLATIESLIWQTTANWHVAIVLEGAPEDEATWKRMLHVLEDSRHKHTVVRLPLRHGNAGWWARNVGMRQVPGDWLAFIDDDAAWYPNHLEALESAITAKTQVAFGDFCWYNASGKYESTRRYTDYATWPWGVGCIDASVLATRRSVAMEWEETQESEARLLHALRARELAFGQTHEVITKHGRRA